MTTYRTSATRQDGWWVLLSEVGNRTIATQARRLDQVEVTVREAIAMATDTAEDSFEIDLVIELGDTLSRELADTRRLASEAAAAQSEASWRLRASAQSLRARGFTVRDSGRLLGVSPQRVSQLLADDSQLEGRARARLA